MVSFFIFLNVGNILYARQDIGIYKGNEVKKVNNQLIITNQNFSFEGETELQSGDIIRRINERYSNYPEILKNFEKPSFFTKQTALIKHYLYFNLTILIFIAIGFSLGKRIILLLNLKLNKIQDFVISTSMGLAVFAIISWFLGFCHLLIPWIVWLVIFLIIILNFKYFKEFLSLVLKQKIDFEIKFFNIVPFIYILFILNINIFDLIRVLPTGWDEIKLYLNLPKLIAENGALIWGIGLNAWALVTTHGFLLFKTLYSAYSLLFLGNCLLLLSLHLLIKKFNYNYSVLLIAFFISIPMVFFQMVEDVKVDLIALNYIVLSLFCFFNWVEFKNDQKLKNNNWLYLSAALAGFAFSVKITTVIFIFTLLSLILYYFFKKSGFLLAIFTSIFLLLKMNYLTIGYDQWLLENKNLILLLIFISILILTVIVIFKNKKNILNPLKILILVFILLILPSLPWLTKNFIEFDSNNKKFLFNRDLNVNFFWPEVDWSQCLQNENLNSLELERYYGDQEGIKKILYLPWTMTMNQSKVTGHGVKITYVWLAILAPLAWIIFLNKKSVLEKYLIIYSITSLVLFLFTSFGIPWYGYFMFIGFMVLLALIINISEQTKQIPINYAKYIALIVISSWILIFIPYRFDQAGPSSIIYYQLNLISKQELIETLMKKNAKIMNILNADLNTKIYKIGTSISYFISQNNQRIFDDSVLASFNCAYRKYSGGKFIDFNSYYLTKYNLESTKLKLYQCQKENCNGEEQLKKNIQKYQNELNNILKEISPIFKKIKAILIENGFKYIIFRSHSDQIIQDDSNAIAKTFLIFLEEETKFVTSTSDKKPVLTPKQIQPLQNVYLFQLQ